MEEGISCWIAAEFGRGGLSQGCAAAASAVIRLEGDFASIFCSRFFTEKEAENEGGGGGGGGESGVGVFRNAWADSKRQNSRPVR